MTGEKAAVPQSANPTTVMTHPWPLLHMSHSPACEREKDPSCTTTPVAAYALKTARMHLQGNVVTKAGAVPAAGVAGPGAANPLTEGGAAEATTTSTDHAEPAGDPAK